MNSTITDRMTAKEKTKVTATRYVVIYLTGITLNMQEFSRPESRDHYIKTWGPSTDRIVSIFEVEV